MSIDVTTYLKYANLQIAAEAFYGKKTAAPGATYIGALTVENLAIGDDHSSKFTATQAQQFVDERWTVVEHESNTSTGFSGTLFKYTGPTDMAKGLTNGELVLSFRSTEFVDDSARDNQAANSMEIKENGWAFGQIADMDAWYVHLRSTYASDFATANGQFSVTGYSLGGHLATAFNLLRKEDAETNGIANFISATYTFNGAGKVNTGSTLTGVLTEFQNLRVNGSAVQFTNSDVRALYEELRSMPNGGASLAQIDVARAQADQLLAGDPEANPADAQYVGGRARTARGPHHRDLGRIAINSIAICVHSIGAGRLKCSELRAAAHA